ncbi:MAG: FG-GAP-like repeat-containing protein, partial [Gammaproteobacteria bacterium]|nr:FG-GAP-like repeat-containing protein [Gammaproteobacteria bacterium]
MAATRSRMMISGLAVACVLWAWGGSQYRSQDSIASKRWTVSTFLEFSRGTLGDAGANTYVTAAGEVKLINLWDLNRDGFIDIVLPNTHDNNEQIDLFIYWDVDENHVGRRTRLPSGGGTGQALGDLNRDGFTDLVVVNGRNGIKSNLDSFIYWGGAQGFDAGRRTELPTLGGMAAAVADLDGDGYPEIVFANSAWAGGRPSGPENASFLYWGSKDGFSIERRQSLPTAAATDVAVADLDRDGSPEVVFANEGSGADLGGAMIYWGGAGGSYAADRRTLLPGQRSSAVALADLNGDRVPEVVLANRYRPLLREPDDRSEWDTDVDSESIRSFVYWGSSGGYSAERRLELPTVAASSVAAGDLNKDGLPDLVFANGPQKSGHAAPGPGSGSPIYWNSAEGFEPRRRTVLPSLNPTDCLIEDLNRDGHPDLVFSNEHNARSHRAPSYVYWGGPAGFDTNRRLELTTLGAAAAGSADFDRDGKADLVFVNRIDGSAGDPVPAYIYWGNEEGKYSVDQRLDLYHPFGSPGE